MSENRDFYAEGEDAAIAGRDDIPPTDVSECGPDAEASWNDGYASIVNEEQQP